MSTATATLEQQIENGVNVTSFKDTIAAVQQDPEIARFQFRATNKWINGSQNRTRIKEFYGAKQEDTSRSEPFVLNADEPAVLLGEDTAPGPLDYVLTALAACTTTTLVYKAALHGIKIDEIETTLEGDIDLQGFMELDETKRRGFEGITVVYNVKSDAPAEQLETFVKGSPVYDCLTNPVPVNVRVEKK